MGVTHLLSVKTRDNSPKGEHEDSYMRNNMGGKDKKYKSMRKGDSPHVTYSSWIRGRESII
jgi:hypothetical protein